MSDPSDTDLGKALLTESLKLLLKRVKDGDATAAELNVAMQAVARMGIEMRPTVSNPMGQLSKALTDKLPFAGSDTAH